MDRLVNKKQGPAIDGGQIVIPFVSRKPFPLSSQSGKKMNPITKSATEIRSIFSANLVLLSKRFDSLSEMSRVTGIERTKLSRFIHGKASPTPEILYRICNYFDLDANILFSPLQDTIPVSSQSTGSANELFQQISAQSYELRDDQLPDGLYCHWQEAISQPGQISMDIVRIYRKNGCKYWKSYDHHATYGFAPEFRERHRRLVSGVLLGSDSGFICIQFNKSLDVINFCYYSYGYKLAKKLHRGRFLIAKTPNNHVTNHGLAVLQNIEGGFVEAIKMARQKRFCEFHELPDYLQSIFRSD